MDILVKLFGFLLSKFRSLNFGFPQAFIKEVSMRVSAEFLPEDVATTKLLIEDGSLSFDGLVSDVLPVKKATDAFGIDVSYLSIEEVFEKILQKILPLKHIRKII